MYGLLTAALLCASVLWGPAGAHSLYARLQASFTDLAWRWLFSLRLDKSALQGGCELSAEAPAWWCGDLENVDPLVPGGDKLTDKAFILKHLSHALGALELQGVALEPDVYPFPLDGAEIPPAGRVAVEVLPVQGETVVKLFVVKPQGEAARLFIQGTVLAPGTDDKDDEMAGFRSSEPAGDRLPLRLLMPTSVELREAASGGDGSVGRFEVPRECQAGVGSQPAEGCQDVPWPTWLCAAKAACWQADRAEQVSAVGPGCGVLATEPDEPGRCGPEPRIRPLPVPKDLLEKDGNRGVRRADETQYPSFELELELGAAPYYQVVLRFESAKDGTGGRVLLLPRVSDDPDVHVLYRPFDEAADAASVLFPIGRMLPRMKLPAGGFACFVGKQTTTPRLLPMLYGEHDRVALFHAHTGTEVSDGGQQGELHVVEDGGEGFSLRYAGARGVVKSLVGEGLELSYGATEFTRYPVYQASGASPGERVYCLGSAFQSNARLLHAAKLSTGGAIDGSFTTACRLPAFLPHDSSDPLGRDLFVSERNALAGGIPLHNDIEAAPCATDAQGAPKVVDHGWHHVSDTCYLTLNPHDAVALAATHPQLDSTDTSTNPLACIEFTLPDGTSCFEPVAPCHYDFTDVPNPTSCANPAQRCD